MTRQWSIDLTQFRRAGVAEIAAERIRCDQSGAVYVVICGDRSVMRFDDRGNLRMKITSDDVLLGFHQPRDIAIDSEGRLFVADFGTETRPPRIDTFDARGKWRASFLLDARPDSIVVDSRGHLYVHAPLQDFRILKYNRGGDRLAAFGRRALRRQCSQQANEYSFAGAKTRRGSRSIDAIVLILRRQGLMTLRSLARAAGSSAT